MRQLLIATSLVFTMIGCQSSGSDTDEDDNIELAAVFDEFIDEVKTSAGNEAIECGQVNVGESDIEANVCVSESYSNDLPFYAIYQLQGIDSFVAGAISKNENGMLILWSFDSSISGSGSSSDSRISQS